MNKLWVVLGNLAICSMVGVAGWSGWRDGAPEIAVVGAAIIGVGIVAIYNTIMEGD